MYKWKLIVYRIVWIKKKIYIIFKNGKILRVRKNIGKILKIVLDLISKKLKELRKKVKIFSKR